jgi:2Fe-2S ferredoxin
LVSIVYVEQCGVRHEVDVAPGSSLMEGARKQGIEAIEGECGGACACATCHVYIGAEWRGLTGEPADFELAMLECANEVDERSRLGCQIKVTAAMDGMTVVMPASQR